MTFIDATCLVLWFFIMLLVVIGPIVCAIGLLCSLDTYNVSRRKIWVRVPSAMLIFFFYIVSWVYFCNIPENIWSRKQAAAWVQRVFTPKPQPPVLLERQ